jgi:hypothetical protein
MISYQSIVIEVYVFLENSEGFLKKLKLGDKGGVFGFSEVSLAGGGVPNISLHND